MGGNELVDAQERVSGEGPSALGVVDLPLAGSSSNPVLRGRVFPSESCSDVGGRDWLAHYRTRQQGLGYSGRCYRGQRDPRGVSSSPGLRHAACSDSVGAAVRSDVGSSSGEVKTSCYPFLVQKAPGCTVADLVQRT